METNEQEFTILFADICDSTPLYEKCGTSVALALIASCLDELAEIARRWGGTVIRSKGDDVLCTFPDPAAALDAAGAMMDVGGPETTAIHVGIHFGPAIAARQDIYGDAVNVAARMLALAKPSEIVASADVCNALPPGRRGQDHLVLLGWLTLKGKQEPMEVYSMVLDDGTTTKGIWDDPAEPVAGPLTTVVPSVTLELEHDCRRYKVREGERFVLGRAPRCNLVLLASCVSREHARVEVRSGRATLSDRSSTGSWVLDAEGHHTTLRRESVQLVGAGRIRLGYHPRDKRDAPEIAFCLRETV